MKWKGKVYKFGDDVDTDMIMPANYLSIQDKNKLAKFLFSKIDPEFYKKIYRKKYFLVGGNNFGCGSSREHAPLAIKAAGIMAIIAKSFAPLFLRNAINLGLPAIECSSFVDECKNEDLIEVNLKKGEIINITQKRVYKIVPLPEFMEKLLNLGGLLPYIKKGI